MKLTAYANDFPGFETLPSRAWDAEVYLDGVLQTFVIRANEERGFVDVSARTVIGGHLADGFMHSRPHVLTHRLFGKVEIKLKNRE